jgi:hypothetical protein
MDSNSGCWEFAGVDDVDGDSTVFLHSECSVVTADFYIRYQHLSIDLREMNQEIN